MHQVQNTGYIGSYDPIEDDECVFPCPACWAYETCNNCLGDGEVEEGAYDPNLGHVRSAMYTCVQCGGNGRICTGWLRNDAEEPDRKPPNYGNYNPEL